MIVLNPDRHRHPGCERNPGRRKRGAGHRNGAGCPKRPTVNDQRVIDIHAHAISRLHIERVGVRNRGNQPTVPPRPPVLVRLDLKRCGRRLAYAPIEIHRRIHAGNHRGIERSERGAAGPTCRQDNAGGRSDRNGERTTPSAAAAKSWRRGGADRITPVEKPIDARKKIARSELQCRRTACSKCGRRSAHVGDERGACSIRGFCKAIRDSYAAVIGGMRRAGKWRDGDIPAGRKWQ